MSEPQESKLKTRFSRRFTTVLLLVVLLVVALLGIQVWHKRRASQEHPSTESTSFSPYCKIVHVVQ